MKNIAFGLKVRGKTQDLNKSVLDALEQVQLSHLKDRLPGQLSGGQQQRVSIARAIVTKPKLILLDEPLSALDAVLRDQMQVLLVKLFKEHGLTAVYVTHDQNEAMSMADKIVVMNAGKVEQFGSPENLYQAPKSRFVADFIGRSNFLPNDNKKMIRLEHLSLTPFVGAEQVDVRVSASRYQGDSLSK